MVISTIIIAIFTALAVLISLFSLINTNKHNTTQNFIELVKEYKSYEFHRCIKKIIGLKDSSNEYGQSIYEIYKSNIKNYEKEKRSISQFFQIVEFLRENKMIKDKLVFGYWSCEILIDYLDTIIKIEEGISQDNSCYSNPSKIKKLLNDAKEWRNGKKDKI